MCHVTEDFSSFVRKQVKKSRTCILRDVHIDSEGTGSHRTLCAAAPMFGTEHTQPQARSASVVSQRSQQTGFLICKCMLHCISRSSRTIIANGWS